MFCALSVVPPTNPRELPDLARLTPFAWAGSAHFVRERHAANGRRRHQPRRPPPRQQAQYRNLTHRFTITRFPLGHAMGGDCCDAFGEPDGGSRY
jgi:hypothetical protein